MRQSRRFEGQAATWRHPLRWTDIRAQSIAPAPQRTTEVMIEASPRHPDIGSNIAQFATAWFNAPSQQKARAASESLLNTAATDGDGQAASVSQVFETLCGAVLWHGEAPREQRLEAVRALLAGSAGFGHARIRWLAESAHGIVGPLGPDDDLIALQQQLRSHPTGADSRRSPIERFWSAAAQASVLAHARQHDDALWHGLQADSLAGTCGIPGLEQISGHLLTFLFLTVGDCEGALATGPRAIEAAAMRGRRVPAMHYNVLLAMLVARRDGELAAHLTAHPWLQAPETLAGETLLHPLLAAVHARLGNLDEAGRHADAAEGDRDADDGRPPDVLANRAWLLAGVRLQQGRAAQARQLLAGAVAAGAHAAQPVSPLNTTQLQSALSAACEAEGDHAGALLALKASSLACVNWVAASMHSRMQVLQGATGAAGEHHTRRLARIDAAVALARAEQAETALEQRTRMLAHVAHEMRNPLGGMLGSTSLLMLSALDERQRRFVSLAQTSAQMLLSLCNDVLDLASLEAGREPLAHTKRLTLSAQVDARLPPELVCDPMRFKQVLMNLLSNAVKFTDQGAIEVIAGWHADAGGQSGRLLVSVRDTGRGISAQARQRLFQEFERGDADSAARHEGTGLGLALCRRLLGQMGGRIDADSAPGCGTTFHFELPLAFPCEADLPAN